MALLQTWRSMARKRIGSLDRKAVEAGLDGGTARHGNDLDAVAPLHNANGLDPGQGRETLLKIAVDSQNVGLGLFLPFLRAQVVVDHLPVQQGRQLDDVAGLRSRRPTASSLPYAPDHQAAPERRTSTSAICLPTMSPRASQARRLPPVAVAEPSFKAAPMLRPPLRHAVATPKRTPVAKVTKEARASTWRSSWMARRRGSSWRQKLGQDLQPDPGHNQWATPPSVARRRLFAQ